MEKLKEWGPLLGAFAAVLTLTLYIAGRNADTRYESQKRDADTRHEAQMELFESLKRDVGTRHEALMIQIEALMVLIEAQNLNADARYEGLMGQIEGVLGQVVGLQKQIDGLNRNADARSYSLKEQAESAKLALAILRRAMGAMHASLDIEPPSRDKIRANVEIIMDHMDPLHESVSEFESMIVLEEAGLDGEFERQESHPVSLR